MNGIRSPREEVSICLVALVVACVLAANKITENGIVGLAGSYAYWITRILIETALFLTALFSIEKYALDKLSDPLIYLLAIVASLVPFTLAITAFDLIVGLPELGLNGATDQPASRLTAFGKELIYLFDNHLTLCTLLLLPRILGKPSAQADQPVNSVVATAEDITTDAPPASSSFLSSLEPPLSGRIYWIEAQEHYVRISTTSESRLVLLRFTDAIRELSSSSGMQVHRSHWVAYADFKALQRNGQNHKLQLTTDELVPVSRSYRQQVEEKLQQLNLA